MGTTHGEKPGGEQGGPRPGGGTHRGNNETFTSSWAGSSAGPTLGSALHFVLHSRSKCWQRLKWEKVEAAEVAVVETSIFTPAGWRQVSGGFE